MKQLVKTAIKKSFNTVGLDIQRSGHGTAKVELEDGNLVVPRIWSQPVFADMIPFRLKSSDRPLVILGSAAEIEFLRAGFAGQGRKVEGVEWDWPRGADLGDIPPNADIIVSKLPLSEQNWRTIIA